MKKTDRKKPRITPQTLECIDALDERFRTLKTLTGLLGLCQESSRSVVEVELVGGTAVLLSREIEEMEADLQCLTASLQR